MAEAGALSSALEGHSSSPGEADLRLTTNLRLLHLELVGAQCFSAMLPALSDSSPGTGKPSITDLPNASLKTGRSYGLQSPLVLAEAISDDK